MATPLLQLDAEPESGGRRLGGGRIAEEFAAQGSKVQAFPSLDSLLRKLDQHSAPAAVTVLAVDSPAAGPIRSRPRGRC